MYFDGVNIKNKKYYFNIFSIEKQLNVLYIENYLLYTKAAFYT